MTADETSYSSSCVMWWLPREQSESDLVRELFVLVLSKGAPILHEFSTAKNEFSNEMSLSTHPEHGVSYTGIYSQGEVQCDTTLSSAEINLHLQTHLIHISNILNNVQEDLDDAKTTIEQVNCSLTNWKTKFDIVCNLAQSSNPRVGTNSAKSY